MFNIFKKLPSWANQTILSILFFMIIMAFMIVGKFIDGAGMIGFYIFLTFWTGGMLSGLISLIRYLVKYIKSKRK